jgi:hypothetical protein
MDALTSTAKTATVEDFCRCNAQGLQGMDKQTLRALQLLVEVFKKDLDPQSVAELRRKISAQLAALDNRKDLRDDEGGERH